MITIKNITIYSDSDLLKQTLAQICKDFLFIPSSYNDFASKAIRTAASIVIVDVKNQQIFDKLIKPYLNFYTLYPLLVLASGDLALPENADILYKPIKYQDLSRKISSLAINCLHKLSPAMFLNAKTLNLIKISRNGSTKIGLTDLECRLLKYLLEHKVATERAILSNVFGYNNASQTNTLKVHMHRLRQKLGELSLIERKDTGEYVLSN